MGTNLSRGVEEKVNVIQRLSDELRAYHPRAVVLFGSMARYLAGVETAHEPNDIDLIMVGDNPPPPVESGDYGCEIELHRFRIHQFVDIAKTLRYDSKPAALSKLYGSVLMKQHSKNIIAACLLLGPSYNDFGIEQIEVDARLDERDYSIHEVLIGEKWWRSISDYARERRGPLKRFSDKIVNRDVFRPGGR
ncbi:MAG: nucleotidyltransferase domain-containing protein [Desulfobacterales bacterium]|nr:nucleotidyltransferase domain-containing protein [Desulfobacterales bacterium]